MHAVLSCMRRWHACAPLQRRAASATHLRRRPAGRPTSRSQRVLWEGSSKPFPIQVSDLETVWEFSLERGLAGAQQFKRRQCAAVARRALAPRAQLPGPAWARSI